MSLHFDRKTSKFKLKTSSFQVPELKKMCLQCIDNSTFFLSRFERFFIPINNCFASNSITASVPFKIFRIHTRLKQKTHRDFVQKSVFSAMSRSFATKEALTNIGWSVSVVCVLEIYRDRLRDSVCVCLCEFVLCDSFVVKRTEENHPLTRCVQPWPDADVGDCTLFVCIALPSSLMSS